MTSERRRFIESIMAEPGDDAPRLVWADWLEERGEVPRADLIRLQCEAAGLPEGDPRRQECEGRAGEILQAHGAGWVAPFRDQFVELAWRRGCLEGVVFIGNYSAAVALALEHEPLVNLQATTRGDRLEGESVPEWVEDLAADPNLRYMTGFMAGEENVPTGLFAALFGSPHLKRLTFLDLFQHYLPMPVLQTLLDAPGGFRLEQLSLNDCLPGGNVDEDCDEVAEAVGAIAQAPSLRGLQSLFLFEYSLGPQCVARLVQSPYLSRDLRIELLDPALSKNQLAAYRKRFPNAVGPQ